MNPESSTTPRSLPLAGIKVLDLSQIGAGPYGASMLGDLGADVIKIEPPQGDNFRYVDDIFGPGDSAYFYGVNRSKRSLSLDLKKQAGRDILYRMVAEADVMIVAFRPEAVRKLGVDYETIRLHNDKLIYCSITAFGEDGPLAHQPGMDILAQALGGIMGMTGEVGGDPVKVGVPIADFTVSYLLGFAVCSALLARNNDGQGQKITLNLLDGQVASLANILTPYSRTRTPVRPSGGGHPQLSPYQSFHAGDGKLMIVACLTDRFWIRLTQALDRSDLAVDERFLNNPLRVTNKTVLTQELERTFRTQPATHWLALLDQHGVPSSALNRLEDVFDDPQVQHNEAIITLEHPEHGDYPVPNIPFRLHGTPPIPHGYAPRLGEHSREILREFGLEESTIDGLLESEVVIEYSPSMVSATP